MKFFYVCLLVIMMAGCAPQLAENLIVPEFPDNETNEINLFIYDKDGKIAKSSLVLQDSNDYSDKKATANFELALNNAQQSDSLEVVYTSNYDVPYGSWAVISIPDDVRQGSMRKNTENIRDAKSTTEKVEVISPVDNDNKEIYSTTGYYNYAENQIEKELLRIGFNVVDRAKYLAKIKEITSGGFEDVADVIRMAAKDSTIRSDYILQINKLSFGKEQRTLYLRSFPEIQQFLDKFPRIATSVPKTYNYPEYNVVFDGKLIEVKTGKIMWLGTHCITSGQVLSRSAMNITINMNVRKYVSNEKEIRDFIAFQNTPEQREKRYNKDVNIPPIQYEYSFDFSVIPDLNELEKEGAENELFENHRKALIKTVTQELIRTIVKN